MRAVRLVILILATCGFCTLAQAPEPVEGGFRGWKVYVGVLDILNRAPVYLEAENLILVGSAGQSRWKGDPYDGLYALDPTSGEVVWFFKTGSDALSLSAGDVDGDGRMDVIVGTSDGKLICVDPKYRRPKWSVQFPGGGVRTMPVVADMDGDGRLEIVLGAGKYLWCVDGATGKVRWKVPVRKGVGECTTPAVADMCPEAEGLEIVIGMGKEGLACFSGKDGRVLWTNRSVCRSWLASPSAVDVGGTKDVFVTSFGCYLWRLNGKTGEVIWRKKIGKFFSSSPALADVDGDGTVEVVVGIEYGVICVDAKTGQIKWRLLTKTPVYSSPAVGDVDGDEVPEVLVGTSAGELLCINAKTGKVKWRFKTKNKVWASPIIGDFDGDGIAEVVFGSSDGYLYCLKVGAAGELKWACAGGDGLWHTGNYLNALLYGKLLAARRLYLFEKLAFKEEAFRQLPKLLPKPSGVYRSSSGPKE